MVGFNDEVIDLIYLDGSQEPDEDTSPAQLAVATNSDLIRIYDLSSFDTSLLAGHADVVLCLARNKEANLLVSGSKDRTARLWRKSIVDEGGRSTWQCIAVCEGHVESIGAVAIARREGKFLASASQDRTVKIWDLAPFDTDAEENSGEPTRAKALTTLKVHDKDINSIDIAPNDKMLVTGSQDKTAKLFGIDYSPATRARPEAEAKLVPLGVFKGHKRGVWSVKFSPKDQVLATGSGDKTIKLWNINDFTCLKVSSGRIFPMQR
jgi:U3 small nucleolar RNA-associated protein 13